MRELTTDRALHAVLRALGIKNPGAVNVQVPVNLVELVGDSSQVSPPIQYATYGFQRTEAAVAGERSGFAIRPGGGGLWFLTFGNYADGMTIVRDDVLALTGTTALVPNPISGSATAGGSHTNVVSFHMTAVAIGPPADAFERDSITGMRTWDNPPLYLGPGERLLIYDDTDNDDFKFACMWREVPPIGG